MNPESSEQTQLEAIVAAELAVPVRASVEWLAGELAKRHGDTVLGVLFYGSCLRQQTDEGVLDYWLVVDDYSRAHANPLVAWTNPIAAPSVFYLERDYGETRLRTKYGVISRRAFDRGSSFGALHPYVFARFSQPARLLACRDEEARRFFVTRLARSIVVLVARLLYLLPRRAGHLRFSLPAFWQSAFARTYDSERRPESDETIRGHYLADADRYDEVALRALRILAQAGLIATPTEHPRSVALPVPLAAVVAARIRWQAMRLVGRTLGLVRLFKTAYTFGDWVPYVLWKLERHTGRRLELSDRQRRHPFLYGWPIILRQIARRNLR